MNLSGLFIRRPVTTTLIQLAIIIFGIAGYRSLPVSDLPPIDFPTVQVSAGLPGASPETMAAAVATPLEKQFSTIPGISQITSTSGQGSTNITLQFDLDRNIDAAAQDVQTAIARSTRQLPPGMPTPPSFQKVNPADQPVFFLTLSSATLPLSVVDEYGETTMAQRISMVSGVAQVSVFGAQKFAVRVDMNPGAMATRGLGVNEVTNAIQLGSVNRPTGTLFGPDRNLIVQPQNGQLFKAQDYQPLVIAYRNGAPIRLAEVAHVYDGVENDKTGSWFSDASGTRRIIYLAIQKQPGTNVVEVVDSDSCLPAAVAGRTSAGRPGRHPRRPVAVDSRIGARRQVHAGPDGDPRRPGHLPVPAEHLGDHHSEPGVAGVNHRDLRGDVHSQLLAGQPVADGPDAGGRLRRRRCHRHARKHRAPSRNGQDADGGRAWRDPGKWPSRFCR